MIVKLIRMARSKGQLAGLRDSIYALTRYVTDADPWAMAMIDREQVRSLAEYLLHAKAHGIEPGEKAGHIGGRNLLTDDLGGQQVEMLAVASSAPRVEYPVVHIIVSWRPGEDPTPAQLEDTVGTVLATTGLSRCPALFAEHTNTAHPHLHIAAVRVDPATGRAAGSEWLIEDLHQAIAILEERHRWKSETNALYYARDGAVFDANVRRFRTNARGDKVVDPASEVMVRDSRGRFVTHRDWTGMPPDLVNVRADILRAGAVARGWADFHRLLDAYQVAYRAKGSGARIHLANSSAKASTVAPDLALKQMEVRWGPFSPHPRDRTPGFDEYREAHAAQLKRLRADRAAAQALLDTWAKEQLVAIEAADNRRIQRVIRTERDAAQQELNAAFAAAIKACTDVRHTKVETWRAAGSPVEPPAVASPSLLLPAGPAERGWSPPVGLRAEHRDWSTRYFDQADRLVFTDHRTVIVVHRPANTGGLDAALKMAAERWGTVRIIGSAAFEQRCAERAAVLGIALVDRDNKPLSAQRLSAPATSIAMPATAPEPTVPEPMRPDYRADPTRQAALDRVLADLARMGPLPMRRRGGTRPRAPLEIVAEADRFDPKPELRVAALFDEDQRIQAFLEQCRATMLADIGNHLLQFDVPLEKKAVVDSLRGQEGLGRAAFLAFEDADFRSMLERVALDRSTLDRNARYANDRRRREPPAYRRDELVRRKKRKVAGPESDVNGDRQVPIPTVLPKSDEASQDGAPPGTQVADEDEVDVVGAAWKDYLAGMGR